MKLPAELAPGVVHLLQVRLDRPPLPISELSGRLAPDERERADRFAHAADSHRHIIGRAIARHALAALTGTPAEQIQLRTSPEGKPHLERGPSFSIAHSGPIVLLAFTREGRLGVDVEAVRPLRDLEGLARSTFCDDETAALRACSDDERSRAFYRLWTRKEAMLKALGAGLGALATLSVSAAPDPENALLRIDPPEQVPDWTVRSIPCDPEVEAAVAWDRPILRLFHSRL